MLRKATRCAPRSTWIGRGKSFNEGLGQTEKPKRNATIAFDGSVTPSSDGVTIQWEETLAGVEQRIVSANREDHVFEAVYKDEPATFTTEMAQRNL